MNNKGVLLQWFINFLIKNTSAGPVKNENMSNKEVAEEVHKPTVNRKLRKEKYTHLLQTIFRVLVLLICN